MKHAWRPAGRAAAGLILGLAAALLTGCGRDGGQRERGAAAVPPPTDSTRFDDDVRWVSDYLGQPPPPGREPRLFAPGIVSTGLDERDLAVSPRGDEILWTVSVGNRNVVTILRSRRLGEGWTAPEVAPFSRDPRYQNLEPAFSPDGDRLWFSSNRPRDREGDDAPVDADLWYVERGPDGDWGEPVDLDPPVNSAGPEYYPSPTRDGTLYFTRDQKDGGSAIWRARRAGEGYAEPERLPAAVNSTDYCFNACVDPDERWLVVPVYGRPDALGGADYYVCFRRPDDTWTSAVQLGGGVSSEAVEEWSPSLSPDGRWLFFMSSRRDPDLLARVLPLNVERLQLLLNRPGNGSSDVYWVSTELIRDLEPR